MLIIAKVWQTTKLLQNMKSVTKVLVDENIIELIGILGDRKTLKGSIKIIDFSKGEIVIHSK